jgi:hypothetical protein
MARQVRTGWRARRRYKLARWACATLGGCTGLALVAAAYASLADPRLAEAPPFVAQSVALVAAGAAVPWLTIEWLWRRERRRKLWDWQ